MGFEELAGVAFPLPGVDAPRILTKQMDPEMAKAIHENAVNHGWYDNGPRDFFEIDVLLITEVGEAMEAIRSGKSKDEFHEEIADVAIRAADALEAMKQDRLVTNPYDIRNPITALHFLAAVILLQSPEVVIRACYRVAEVLGFDLDEAVRKKHEYNKTRPYKHGKTC